MSPSPVTIHSIELHAVLDHHLDKHDFAASTIFHGDETRRETGIWSGGRNCNVQKESLQGPYVQRNDIKYVGTNGQRSLILVLGKI